jgi:hypothetical protein
MPIHSIVSRCQNAFYTSNIIGLPPKPPKFTQDQQRCIIVVRVVPYAHTQHIKVPGCGIKSEAWCSLNNYIATSHWLRGLPQHHQQSSKSTPYLLRPITVTVRVYSNVHDPQHMMRLKHLVYIQNGCGMHFTGGLSFNHDIITSFGLRSTGLSQQILENPAPTFRGQKM